LGFFAPACGGATTSNGADADAGFTGDPNNPTTTVGTDIPCDVGAVLAKCTGCHSNPPTQMAPMSLLTYADLTAAAPDYPGQNEAQRCLARMQDPKAPMPPKPHDAVTADDIATFQKWVDAGMPQGTCDTPATSVDAGPDPFAVAPKCTSGNNWTLGNRGSVNMRPGGACNSCHATTGGEAPMFAFGGTVYPTAHEPNDCNSVIPGGPASVVVTDSNGKVITRPVNAVGNFYYLDTTGTFTPPYTAKVVHDGKERVMTTPQTDGDCNNCHTQTGSKGSGTKPAPGRIILP
jgi:hypothetical protein